MKRKVISVILATAMIATLAIGCGSGETATETVTETTSGENTTEETQSIIWAGWSGEEEASKDIFQRMMDTYEQESGNDVTWVGWTWADTAQQLLIRTQGNEQLDIAQVDIGIFSTLSKAGVLADLNEVIGTEYLTENFQEATLEVGNVDGKQLAMPWSMASISMVYNPEILNEAGWTETPKTMEEFEKCLEDVAKLDGEIIPYAVSTKDATCAGDFMPWLWTYGGSIFDEAGNVSIDSDAAVECVKWYQDIMSKGYIAMDMGRGEARQMFAQGKVAFYDDAVVAKGQAVSNGVLPEDVVDVCSAMERPVLVSGDQPQSTMWGHMLVVFEKSEYKEAAVELAKTLVSDEVALDYFENNGMPPVTKSASETELVKNDEYLSGFLKSTETAKLDETTNLEKSNEVKTIITEELQAALLGQKTAEEAVKDMRDRIQAL